NNAARVANTLLVFSEIWQKENQRREARASCQEALQLLSATPNQPLYANALFLCGKLAETEWREHTENEESIKDAQARYEQALALFAERHDTAAVARVSRQ